MRIHIRILETSIQNKFKIFFITYFNNILAETCFLAIDLPSYKQQENICVYVSASSLMTSFLSMRCINKLHAV